MLVIRLQRVGRKGHAQFRVVVQDSRRTPTSGKIVAQLGTYDPHAKTINLNAEKAAFYLEHGAQPSPRVVKLLSENGVKMPAWVKVSSTTHKKEIRNPEKLRKNQPKEEVAEEAPTEAPVAEESAEAEAPATEAPAEA